MVNLVLFKLFLNSLVKKAKSRLWQQSGRRERRSARKRRKSRRGSWRKKMQRWKKCSVRCRIRRRTLQKVRNTLLVYVCYHRNAYLQLLFIYFNERNYYLFSDALKNRHSKKKKSLTELLCHILAHRFCAHVDKLKKKPSLWMLWLGWNYRFLDFSLFILMKQYNFFIHFDETI